MSEILMNTFVSGLKKARTVNCTDTSFPSTIPTITEPSGDAGTAGGRSIIELVPAKGGQGPNGIYLIFFGAGTDTQTFSVRGIGWRVSASGQSLTISDQNRLWIPVPLFEFSCALSVMTGIANRAAIDTDLFCDTITVTGTTANAGVGVNVTSPANDTIADAYVDLKGCQKFELIWDMTGATSGNAFYQLY